MRFRLATVFGCSPRMRLDLLVNDLYIKPLRTDILFYLKQTLKELYPYRDVCEAIMMTLNNFENFKGETFNLGLSDANLSKLELCNKIRTFANFEYH